MAGKNTDIELLNKENLIVYKRHAEGKTLEVIAEELGYANASGVQKAYKRALKRIEHPDRAEYMQAQVDRYDKLIETYTLPAIQGNLKHAYFLLEVMSKQAKLLGLEAPTVIQQEVINSNGPRSLDDEVTELARVIDYIEGIAANITSIPTKQIKGKQIEMDATGAQGTITS